MNKIIIINYANMYINNTGTPTKERLVSKESEVLCGTDKGLMHKASALLSLHCPNLILNQQVHKLASKKKIRS